MPGGQARRWAFTLNNYTDEEVAALEELSASVDVRRMICGKEKGEQETPHIQGAVCWKMPMRFERAKNLIGERAHLEIMHQTWKVNRTYCSKENEVFIDKDDSRQGERTDFVEAMESVRDGARNMEMFESHPSVMARYPRFVREYRAALMEEKSREFRRVEVHIIWGKAGTNKTRSVLYDAQGRRNDVFIVPESEKLKWWDGYAGEDAILLDEFGENADEMVSFAKWKRICDGHSMYLETKGGNVYACWTKIYICSNVNPQEWWGGMYFNQPEFTRRITSITEKQ